MDCAKLSWVLGCLLLTSCFGGDPSDALVRVDTLVASGEAEQGEALLRRTLEKHPDDLEVLLVAAEFYLVAEPAEGYRPRLALHYAMRADKAGQFADKRAHKVLVRAHRAAGGFAEGDKLIAHGLASVRHPDAGAPQRLKPVDPELLDPTLPNLLEQRRRERGEGPSSPCPKEFLSVPAGRYPLDEQEVTVEAVCISIDPQDPAGCLARGHSPCGTNYQKLAAGPLAGLLQGGRGEARCCVGPVQDWGPSP